MHGSMIREHALRPVTLLVLTQVGLGLGSSFFNSAGVVVLVPSQGCSSCESLLAVGVRAFVRALARVNATMTGKRRRVTERLAAAFAHVRLLASVNSRVNSQGRPLNELLSTAGPVTSMGTNACVDSLMASKITATRESLVAS